ncbi:MAG: hypothetical protein SWE60_27040 [Thermodesulfobacteriota bacterium]|nr:hypothetical protein [Thermodesulfobacteriota bacterium]
MMKARTIGLLMAYLLFTSTILLATSLPCDALTAADVEKQVKAAMGTGTAAKDAVRSAVATAIAEGMSAKEAARAAATGAVAAALAMGRDIHPAIRGAVLGAAMGAGATGLDMNGAIEGASEGGITAAAAAGADMQIAAQAALCGAVRAAVEQGGNTTSAVSSAVTGVLTGATSSGLGPEETEKAVHGAAQGVRAATTGQARAAAYEALKDALSAGARAHGLPPGSLMAAAKAGMADMGPCRGCPARKAGERPAAMPSLAPDRVEPVPDPTASPI